MTSRTWIAVAPNASRWGARTANSFASLNLTVDTYALLNVGTAAEILLTKPTTSATPLVLHWHPATNDVSDITDHMMATAEVWADHDLPLHEWVDRLATYLNGARQ